MGLLGAIEALTSRRLVAALHDRLRYDMANASAGDEFQYCRYGFGKTVKHERITELGSGATARSETSSSSCGIVILVHSISDPAREGDITVFQHR